MCIVSQLGVDPIRVPCLTLVTLALVAAPAQAKRPACTSGNKFLSTSYGPPWGGIQGTGVTANGTALYNRPRIYGIAVDPRLIRLGARVKVWPNPFGHRGYFKAFDTGGAIKGNRIDFYDWRGRGRQLGWGKRPVRLCVSR